MLASLATAPFSDEQWLFEPKLDGFRTLAFLNKGKVRLQSRQGLDVTGHYPALVESLEHQPVSQLILDGEIIGLDAKGALCFQCLQGYLKSMNRLKAEQLEPPSALIYYVFDVLYLDGYDFTGVPLKQRKELLHSMLDTSRYVSLVEHFAADGRTVYDAAVQNGLEGVIAKRLDSVYEAGKRSTSWLKIKKVNSDEFVVGGLTQGKGSRAGTFGALLLGYYNTENRLLYAGNVGRGFDEETLLSLRKRLDKLKARQSPFSAEPELPAAVTWVRPETVVEVKFAEWTRDGRLRAPVFLRVREDKPATSVRPTRVIETTGKSAQTARADESDTIGSLLERLANPKTRFTIQVEGQAASFTNLDKELWPETAESRSLTKRDLITYLVRVSPWLLAHLKDRPLTLSCYPNGIYGEHFFQKHYQPIPAFVETVLLASHDTPARKYIICNNLATLIWLGQIADIELHTWSSRVKPRPAIKARNISTGEADYYASYPDFIVFDLDPYMYSGKEAAGAEPELNRAALRRTCQVALKLKETLDVLSFPSFVKTSGRTGLHIFLPILRQLDFHATHAAAETISRFLSRQHPNEITVDWPVGKRTGKIFLDYSQNVRARPWSLCTRPVQACRPVFPCLCAGMSLRRSIPPISLSSPSRTGSPKSVTSGQAS
jgi:bifunctional non-homologous end joining protein LigD